MLLLLLLSLLPMLPLLLPPPPVPLPVLLFSLPMDELAPSVVDDEEPPSPPPSKLNRSPPPPPPFFNAVAAAGEIFPVAVGGLDEPSREGRRGGWESPDPRRSGSVVGVLHLLEILFSTDTSGMTAYALLP